MIWRRWIVAWEGANEGIRREEGLLLMRLLLACCSRRRRGSTRLILQARRALCFGMSELLAKLVAKRESSFNLRLSSAMDQSFHHRLHSKGLAFLSKPTTCSLCV